MSLELQGQTWTGEENAEATGGTGVQGHETEREDQKEPRPRKRTVMSRDQAQEEEPAQQTEWEATGKVEDTREDRCHGNKTVF